MTGEQRQQRIRAATIALARLNTSILMSSPGLAAELILNAADEAVGVVAGEQLHRGVCPVHGPYASATEDCPCGRKAVTTC